ncbi:retinol-binding protein 3 [Pangasianodon hypophthalmus]|uniref:retinol-binding protein 3 n=1 Tax=Pangasianodon hypophthalmus TaxID=310915 RepID=UPI002307E38A|nr:retinol-binding protein 3 [Pangasianodon hypophthalmus]
MAHGLVLLAILLAVSNNAHCDFSPMLITDLAKVLTDNYCSPEILSGMEEVIGIATSNTEILSIQDPSILASMLTDGVRSTIGDPRVKVTYDPDYVPAAPPGIHDIPPEQLAAVVKGTVNVEVLENDIAYLKIQHIIGEEIAQKIGPLLLQHVWDKVLPTSAMILDLRYAVSGELSGIPYIVSYYTDAEPLIHIDSVYDRPSNSTTELWSMPTLLGKRYGSSKPLIILTSKNTVGIAEDVVYCLKNLKRATVVGENTAGGSVKIDKIKLGNTDFYVSLPVAKSTNPITGKSWEVKGVAPDVEVNAEDAIDAAVAIIKLRAEIPAIVKSAASLIAENYAFDSIAVNVAEKLEALVASGEYSMITTNEELKAKLSADLLKLSGDKCLKITDNIPMLPPVSPPPEMFVALVKDSFHTDVFENNIGYMRFDMFGDFPQVAAVAQIIVEHVWNKVVDTDAMIIDLRNNIGGSTKPIAGLCSYFFDDDMQIVLDKLYDRSSGTTKVLVTLPELTGRRYGSKKGLLILTSGVTAGAAEEFVYIMKRFGRAMIVGEPTHGSCQPPKTFQVSDSDVFLSIPVTHSDTTQGPAWEGAGIAPHVAVAANEALDVAKGILNKHFLDQK